MLTYAVVAVVNYLNTLKREEGQGMVEYGLLLALIAVAVVAALTLLGPGLEGLFSDIVVSLNDTVSGATP